MLFRILHDERSGELSYVLADNDAREAVVVDPRSRDLPVLQALLGERDLRLRWVLRTHQHDHLQSHELERLRSLGAPVVQGETCEGTHTVADGEHLPVGNEIVRVITTPGHTAGCLSFVWRDRVFCGGLLAVDACPYQPHPADPAALWDSITLRLFTLPDETLLFAGHEQRARAVSTVLEQRRWHPFFARQTRDAFLARVAALPTQAADAVSAAAGHNTQSV
ncbi:MAG: MBL fold metallo-hydrolase [Hydrogenophaga sp.]|nr:MBL fold metallo-hydrolase [Hydrogenophaga sp.]